MKEGGKDEGWGWSPSSCTSTNLIEFHDTYGRSEWLAANCRESEWPSMPMRKVLEKRRRINSFAERERPGGIVCSRRAQPVNEFRVDQRLVQPVANISSFLFFPLNSRFSPDYLVGSGEESSFNNSASRVLLPSRALLESFQR